MNATRFAGLSPRVAGLVITVVVLVIVYGLYISKPLPAEKSNIKGDLDLYKAIVEGVHDGEGYYRAAGEELRRMGYPVRSVFNWRLPFHGWLLGHLTNPVIGKMVIASLSLLVLLIWMTVFHQHRYSFSRTFIGGLILTGPLILSVLTDSFLSHEVWAGTLISLSLAAYGRGWTAISVISGLSALLLRELAIPFICVMLVMAFMEGRRRQALLWLGCIVLFGCVFLIHWSAVKHAWMPGDLAIKKGWVRFGGWEFVLKTAQTNTFLLLAPPWVAAILLPLSLLGLAGWRDQPGARIFLTVYVYVIAFSILGKAFNVYWGWMYTSIMLLGLLYLPCSLRDLFLSITSVLRKHSSKT